MAVRILFSSLGSHGHTYPLLPLATAAREQGHDVLYAVDAGFHEPLRKLGFTVVDAGISIWEAFSQANSLHGTPEFKREMLRQTAVDAFGSVLPRKYVEDLTPALERDKPDLVVFEIINPGAGIAARQAGPLDTTGRLADVVRRAMPRQGYSRIDPATRTFQAIRIWVNRELEGLDAFLGAAADRLQPDGRLAVITFHSLEDRIVKHTLRALQSAGRVTVRTKRPVWPTEAEVGRNPRARSAKLRAAGRPPQGKDEA